MKRILFLVILATLSFVGPANYALSAEQTDNAWPLGPIGGKIRLWPGKNFVRVHEVTPGAPGALAGLRTDDFIYGAFGKEFDVLGDNFQGPVRQLAEAIDHAQIGDGSLPLMVLRPGVGTISITITLPTGGMGPLYPLTSSQFHEAYEAACANLHQRVMNDADGNIGFPTGFVGLSLLGHPDWNETTGERPYRLSINKIRDDSVSIINSEIYAPVEDLLLDQDINGTGQPSANPNFANSGLGNWELGACLMFLAEYYTKSGDASVFPALQRGAELCANRVQWWKQPVKHSNGYSPGFNTIAGMTSHGGVTGDYTHLGWGGGINMAGVHLFCGLAMAKRAGVDMSVRPRDGHYFGYDLHPGDTIPPEIASALPSSIVLPGQCADPDTGATTINDPFWYDMTLDQKFWLQWDFLRRTSNSAGSQGYGVGSSYSTYDSGGRTPSALFGTLVYQDGEAYDATVQSFIDLKKTYITLQHDKHLNAHAYNMGGSMFMPLSLPYLDDVSQRYFLENWKFFHIFSQEPDGTLSYMRGRGFGDVYQDVNLVSQVCTAIYGSVARGGLPHVPGYSTNRVMVRFKQPYGMTWPTPEARYLSVETLSHTFSFDLLDSSGNVIDPSQVTVAWTVESGPATGGIIASPSSETTVVNFPTAGVYRLRLDASHDGLSTSEAIDVEVQASELPEGWRSGFVDYEVYTGISGVELSNLEAAAKYPDSPDVIRTLDKLEGDYTGDYYGARISGYLVPPTTGDYFFHIASDDSSELRLNPEASTGDVAADEVGLSAIASVSGWTSAYQWDKYPSQQSAPVSLVAGKIYRFEVLHKEHSGGDRLAVAWTPPGGGIPVVIGSSYLALPPPPLSIVSQPSDQSAYLGDTVVFSITPGESSEAFYQWFHDGVPYGAPLSEPSLTLDNVSAGMAGEWACSYTTKHGSLMSETAILSISDPEIGTVQSGGLWQDVFYDIPGSSVNDLRASGSFPLYPGASGVITVAERFTMGDKYGQRWTGWVVPPETANYRFFVTADDSAELWLSSDEFAGHKELRAQVAGPVGSRKWQSVAPSEWIPLVAGQRYYIEVLHKENSSGDHCAITWQKEGDPDPVDGDASLPVAYLEYRYGGVLRDEPSSPPLARDDEAAAVEGKSFLIDVLFNDLDENNSTLSIDSVSTPAHGFALVEGNQIRYIHDGSAELTDQFTYVVRNQNGLTDTGTVSISAADFSQGLIGYWHLDEGSGTSAFDSSGENRHGALGGTPVWQETGALNGALSLEQSGDVVDVGELKEVLGKASATLCFWVKTTMDTSLVDTFRDAPAVVGYNHPNWWGTDIKWGVFDSDGRIGIRGKDDELPAFSTTSVNDGQWHYIVLTRDVVSGETKVYVDGTLEGVGSGSTELVNTSFTSFGQSVGSQPYQGMLDEICIYDRVLTAAEAHANYRRDAGLDLVDSDGDGLNDYWEASNFGNMASGGGSLDTDGDLIPDILEYALGLSPVGNSQLPMGQLTESGDWIVSFDHYANRGGMDLYLEWSSTLESGSWQTIARSLGGAPVEVMNGAALLSNSGSNPSAVEVRCPQGFYKGFIRWKATKN